MKRVLFAGTPDFALPTLQALYDHGYTVVGVLTQPDKLGAKNKLTPPPTKVLAEKLGCPCTNLKRCVVTAWTPSARWRPT